jgi:RNA polymerase sigma-70 factor (ECF subfamily)
MGTNSPPPEQITDLLIDWSNGDQAALDKLMPLVYQELRSQARHHLRNERAGHTLQTTALVHEAYLRLAEFKKIQWQERAHFFAIAAQVMRRILVENARSRGRAKRGGNAHKVSIEDAMVSVATICRDSPDGFLNMLALDEALQKLEAIDRRKTRVVEMRFFAGMDNEAIASVLNIAPNTVIRDWNFAEAWLRKELAA